MNEHETLSSPKAVPIGTYAHGISPWRASAASLALGLSLAACTNAPMRPASQHLGMDLRAGAEASAANSGGTGIPQPVSSPFMPPPPRNGPVLETYTVVVSDIEITELLFAMARDAKINVDVHPAVRGRVTINAVEQTLPQILKRLSRQVDLRYEFEGPNLVVMPDRPFVRHYPIDYVNVARKTVAKTSIATQISSTGSGALSPGGASQANNNSTTEIENTSNHRFWQTLTSNLQAMLAADRSARAVPADAASAAAGGATGSKSGASAPTQGAGAQAGGVAAAATAAAGTTAAAATGGGASASGGTGASAAAGGAGGSDGAGSSGSSEVKTVIANPETGIVSVYATSREHELVREYIDKVMSSARRQVLIEATVVEVQLSEQFQQGVNWQKLRLDGSGWSFVQQPNGTSPLPGGAAPLSGPGGINFPITGGSLPGGASATGAANPSLGVMRYLRSNADGNIGFALSLLQSFGKVKVLSSPKISVLNNQTAVLKVVDNRVYFTIGVQITPGTSTSPPIVTYTSTPNTVPVGFVMSVTPQIEKSGTVTINMRPTISRIVGYVNDPSPALAQANVVSRIPEIQTREIESIIKVHHGDVAVMGGLMQESIDDRSDAVPGPANVPLFGELFKYRNDSSVKSELVIFLRPVVIRDPSLNGDYRGFRDLVPKADFFETPRNMPVPRAWVRSDRVTRAGADER
ncbi:MAG: secretin N-terminal domain-containing protein [Burkholderiaceae bacterium]